MMKAKEDFGIMSGTKIKYELEQYHDWVIIFISTVSMTSLVLDRFPTAEISAPSTFILILFHLIMEKGDWGNLF